MHSEIRKGGEVGKFFAERYRAVRLLDETAILAYAAHDAGTRSVESGFRRDGAVFSWAILVAQV